MFFVLVQFTKQYVNAGWINGGYYTNAPAYVAGAQNDAIDRINNTINSSKVTPLFTANGINYSVVADLLNILNDGAVVGNKTFPTAAEEVTYFTAKDFGKYDNQTNAQLLLKLLDNTGNANYGASTVASTYWQVVYRTTTTDQDILTLYMVNGYTGSWFNDVDGDYSASTVQTFVKNTYDQLTQSFNQLDEYVVAPKDLPMEWQSSAYQTSQNSVGNYFAGDQASSAGASGNGGGYSINNGMDGQNARHSSWVEEAEDANTPYSDKLWLPSAFEVLSTGYGTGYIPGTDRYYDGVESVSVISDTADKNTGMESVTDDGRTGLWELNAYDRATGAWAWLRSCDSDGRRANVIFNNGRTHAYQHNDGCMVRAAIHIDLEKLKTYTLNFDSNGSGEPNKTLTKTCGETLILPDNTAFTRYGYELIGWATTSTATTPTYACGAEYNSDDFTTLYAVWEQNIFQINASSNITHVSCVTGSGVYEKGANVTLSANDVDKRFRFVQWQSDGVPVSTQSTYSFTASVDINLVAIYQFNLSSMDINYATQLFWIADRVQDGITFDGVIFNLVADIDITNVTDQVWQTIGDSTHNFAGIVNGNGYNIRYSATESSIANGGVPTHGDYITLFANNITGDLYDLYITDDVAAGVNITFGMSTLYPYDNSLELTDDENKIVLPPR